MTNCDQDAGSIEYSQLKEAAAPRAKCRNATPGQVEDGMMGWLSQLTGWFGEHSR